MIFEYTQPKGKNDNNRKVRMTLNVMVTVWLGQ
jgi:hypothetical protein